MKKGFIFIETIIVICVLTVGLMSLYGNYSKILSNTRELNTFDTAEYNYKTYFFQKTLEPLELIVINNECQTRENIAFSEDELQTVKICGFYNMISNGRSIETFIDENKSIMDAYIIDYLLSQDFNENNDTIILAEYKKEDKQNPGEYFTYVSSLNW